MKMIRAAFFCDKLSDLKNVYAQGRCEQIAELTDLYNEVITSKNFNIHIHALNDLEVIFFTWGMLKLSKEQLDSLPNLKAVFYGAGSVKEFARPMLERGITIVSAWAANAVPVAEFALSEILLANKGYYRNIRDSKNASVRIADHAFRGKGNFGEKVSLIGAGMVGRKLIELLKDFELKVQVYDPYLSDEDAEAMSVCKVSLEEAFSSGHVVSNHVPDIPSTKGMLNGELLKLMKPNSTFINTGRGATVLEGDLISFLKERPDVTALLDVTMPEPPLEASEFYQLPNVYLTSHIAGSLGDEVVRMADYCISEFIAWRDGKPLKYSVSLNMLETMA